jgi:hypothetical protein
MSEGKVWIVEQGAYSDRHVVGVFTEEALAKACATGCDGEAEEWTLDPHADQYRQGLSPWHVQMLADGTAIFVDRTTPPPVSGGPQDYFYKRPVRVENGCPVLDWINPTEEAVTLFTDMWARDAEHAVKIANERRAMHVANGTWGVRGPLDKPEDVP